MAEPATVTLQKLGFTGLEATLYISLLTAPGSTGYALARAASKPVANTYKALETLERRGAVTSQDGQARTYRAVPFMEVLNALSSDFAALTAQAGKALSRLEKTGEDDRVYRLTGRDVILERARALIASAKGVLLVDGFPSGLEAIVENLRSAVKRGVAVHVKAYAPFTLRGARVATAVDGDAVMRRRSGTWLNLVIDYRESLIALLRDDRSSAVWTANPYISFVYYSALSSEIVHAQLRELAKAQPDIRLKDALRKCSAPSIPDN
ncbi:MAG: TrmB family transcriptional regulator [Candidatus Eremiobacteraeota bacterium]|nr:TrmB family transcriptional regulator [Candidatus Eremiobacteraeota bacterium]